MKNIGTSSKPCEVGSNPIIVETLFHQTLREVMMKIRKTTIALAASLAGFALSTPASAAFISIDDSNPTSITITAGDFEYGFSVNGTQLTTGLGNSGSITLTDAGISIDGSWIDNGDADGDRVDILFALAGNPGFATSGIEFGATSANNVATLSGSFGGYVNPSSYFSTALPTLLQNGQTGTGGMPFLSVSFISENTVPEPASLALLGIGLAGLSAMRRRKTA